MILAEIVVEGVRRFKQMRRIPLKQGYNLIYGANESGKSSLYETLMILLDPTRNVGEEEEYPSWGPPGNSRAGVIVQEGQEVYRITKDFVNGQVSVSRRNPQTQKFDPIATDPAKIDAFLRQNLGLPPISVYKKIFCFDREDLPTGRPKVVVKRIEAPAAQMTPGVGPAFGAPMMAAAPASPPPGYGLSVDEKKRKIDELRVERDKAEQLKKIQFELDGLQGQMDQIDTKMKAINTTEEQRDQLKKRVDRMSSFKDLPPDIVRGIEDIEGAQRNYNKHISNLDQKISGISGEYTALNSRTPFFKEQKFIIGIGLVVAAIIYLSVGVSEMVPVLGNLPAFLAMMGGMGLALWIGWNELNAGSREAEVKKELDKYNEELREAEKKFEVENSVINKLKREAGVEDFNELRDRMKEFRDMAEKLDELNAKLDKEKRTANFPKLERDRKEIADRIDEMNNKVHELSSTGFQQEPEDLQRQIDGLQFSIDNPGVMPPPGTFASPAPIAGGPAFGGAPHGGGVGGGIGGDDYLGGGDGYLGGGMSGGVGGVSGGVGGVGGGFDIGGPPSGGVSVGGDSTMISTAPTSTHDEPSDNIVDDLWNAVEAFAGMDRSTLIMQIKDNFNFYVQAFTNKGYLEGDLSNEKALSLRTSLGSYIDLMQLPPSARDAAWLALKLAIIENLLAKKNLPVVMDDPLRLFDDTRLAGISNALKRIGAKCQVVLLSTQKAHGKLADNALSISPPQEGQ